VKKRTFSPYPLPKTEQASDRAGIDADLSV
jgi:hypothetical protein